MCTGSIVLSSDLDPAGLAVCADAIPSQNMLRREAVWVGPCTLIQSVQEHDPLRMHLVGQVVHAFT